MPPREKTYDRYTRCLWLPSHYESGDEVEYDGTMYEVIRERSTGCAMGFKNRKYYDVLAFCYLDEVLLGKDKE